MFFFHSGRIRILVAMATYSSHRLIMGKLEISTVSLNSSPHFIRLLSELPYLIAFFFCLNGDIRKIFLQKCLLSSPLRFI